MSSVTQRINEIKQPRGGYLNPKELSSVSLGFGIEELAMDENISPSLVGITVDYLTCFMTGTKITDAFIVSFYGAKIMNELNNANQLAKGITGLDDRSISNAVKLSGYDSAFRAGPLSYRPVEELNPDKQTCNNIRIMVNRGIEFFKLYGPVTTDGFTFEPFGYTDTVDSGDGDFLTSDTLWDFKVSKKDPTNKHTLQLIMYFIMGKHSGQDIYKPLTKIGIFNPRLNKVYTYDMNKLDLSVINEIENTVIGY